MADETLAQLAGNAEQREARHYLEFRELSQPYEGCMQAHGIDFVAEYHTIYAGYVPDGTEAEGTWMGALNRKPSDPMLANAEAAHDDETGTLPREYQTEAFEKAKGLCSDTNSVFPESPSTNEIGDPKLLEELTGMLTGVERQLGPIGPYTECMKEVGIDYTSASDGEEGWLGLYMYLSTQMPRPPLPGEDAAEAWLQYLDMEERTLAADAECRVDQYEKGLELLGPRLADFREANANGLQAASQNWEKFVTRARAADWTYPGDS